MFLKISDMTHIVLQNPKEGDILLTSFSNLLYWNK